MALDHLIHLMGEEDVCAPTNGTPTIESTFPDDGLDFLFQMVANPTPTTTATTTTTTTSTFPDDDFDSLFSNCDMPLDTPILDDEFDEVFINALEGNEALTTPIPQTSSGINTVSKGKRDRSSQEAISDSKRQRIL